MRRIGRVVAVRVELVDAEQREVGPGGPEEDTEDVNVKMRERKLKARSSTHTSDMLFRLMISTMCSPRRK